MFQHIKHLEEEDIDDMNFFMIDFASNYIPNAKINNLDDDWKDGKLIISFLNGFDKSLQIEACEDPKKNFDLALQLSQTKFNVPDIISYQISQDFNFNKLLIIYFYFFILFKKNIIKNVKPKIIFLKNTNLSKKKYIGLVDWIAYSLPSRI
jgi:hypothetical protein